MSATHDHKGPSTEECADFLERIVYFLDNELDEADCSAVRLHLDACNPCLERYDLQFVEQPCATLEELAEVRRRVAAPIAADESVASPADVLRAVELEACDVVNVKPGRVGGYLEARRIHDVCVAAGVPVWCGGMLETGLGRAANVALAALPGFTLPGDTSASGR